MKVITIIVPSNQCHLLIKEYNLIEAALKKFEMINKQKCCLCISK